MHKTSTAVLSLLLLAGALPAAASAGSASASDESGNATAQKLHRYMVIRTFPAGALDGIDATVKEKVNATNAEFDVRWVHSFANQDLTKTYCIYEGPSEEAIYKSAEANGLPVDTVIPIPRDLEPAGD